MPSTFTYTFNTPTYKGQSTFNTGLFIGGQWVDPVEHSAIDVVNPATGSKITSILAGSSKDVDIAVAAARKAYKTAWGLKVPGVERGRILNKLADLIEANAAELAALDALNVGKTYAAAKNYDVKEAISIVRYFAGWADKTNENKFAYSRHEPYGVVAAIVPWNFPLMMTLTKIAPALATGNVVILKPSEVSPLSALRLCDIFTEAGVPAGVVNVVNGYGHTVGQPMAEHPNIDKITFTGSTFVGRKIMKAAADSNLKDVSLELGGKSPVLVFDDADVEQAVKWVAQGIFRNAGQACVAGSRIFVQEGIYDAFVSKFAEAAKATAAAAGDPFAETTEHGPQVSQTQFDRVMGYIASGKREGATVAAGGDRLGDSGYFIKPTIFTDVKANMEIAKEEIFGPVAAVFKFKTEEEAVESANDTVYGLACHIFTENASRAIRMAHAIEAGMAWVNSTVWTDNAVPFGGYKQSGNGREQGEYALETYTQVKGVHINLGLKI